MKATETLQKAIVEFQKGNMEAFEDIYSNSNKYLFTCIINVVRNDQIAEDIMQETYMEICKSLNQLSDSEKFLSWAGMIANRKCFAYLKKNGKDILLNENDTTFEDLPDEIEMIPESIMQDREAQKLIRKIIDDLPEVQKLCIIGYYYNEEKQDKIAEELGIPVNTVKTNLSRAKAKIKEGVLTLEKKEGTRLYSFAPVLLFLFSKDVEACTLPQSLSGMAVTVVSSVTGKAIAGKGTATAGKAAGMAIKKAFMLKVAAVCTVAAVAVTGIVIHTKTKETITLNETSTEQSAEHIEESDTEYRISHEVEEWLYECAKNLELGEIEKVITACEGQGWQKAQDDIYENFFYEEKQRLIFSEKVNGKKLGIIRCPDLYNEGQETICFYYGEWNGEQRDGTGILFSLESGEYYNCRWENDKPEGKVTGGMWNWCTIEDGEPFVNKITMEGTTVDGIWDGNCKVFLDDGTTCVYLFSKGIAISYKWTDERGKTYEDPYDFEEQDKVSGLFGYGVNDVLDTSYASFYAS